jgi:hypothetical protein
MVGRGDSRRFDFHRDYLRAVRDADLARSGLICPTVDLWLACSAPLQKYSLFSSDPNHRLYTVLSRARERGVGHRHERLARDAVDAMASLRRLAWTNDTNADGEVVWSWRPVLFLVPRECTKAARLKDFFNFPETTQSRHFWPGSFLSLDHGLPGFRAAVQPVRCCPVTSSLPVECVLIKGEISASGGIVLQKLKVATV